MKSEIYFAEDDSVMVAVDARTFAALVAKAGDFHNVPDALTQLADEAMREHDALPDGVVYSTKG